MISLKTPEEIEAVARAGGIIAALYDVLPERVQPGATTAELVAMLARSKELP